MEKYLSWTTKVGTRIMDLKTCRIYEVIYSLGDYQVVQSSQDVELEIAPEDFKNYVEVASAYPIQ